MAKPATRRAWRYRPARCAAMRAWRVPWAAATPTGPSSSRITTASGSGRASAVLARLHLQHERRADVVARAIALAPDRVVELARPRTGDQLLELRARGARVRQPPRAHQHQVSPEVSEWRHGVAAPEHLRRIQLGLSRDGIERDAVRSPEGSHPRPQMALDRALGLALRHDGATRRRQEPAES